MCVHDTAKRALAEAPRARRLPALTPQREPSGRRSRTTEFWGTLRVDVLDDEIVVSLPGASYTVTYFKRPNSPQLLAQEHLAIRRFSHACETIQLPCSRVAHGQRQDTRARVDCLVQAEAPVMARASSP